MMSNICASLRLSVTGWYCIKMAKRRMTQTAPLDSPGISGASVR